MPKFDISIIGQTAAGGWGDKVVMGIITRYIKGISQEKCWEYISEDKDLEIDNGKVKMYRGIVKKLPINDITENQVLDNISLHRPDIVDIIINNPKGVVWLHRQLENFKEIFSSKE